MSKRSRLRDFMEKSGFISGSPLPPEQAPPEVPSRATRVDADGVPLPPEPPDYVPSGILIEWFPERGGSSFNFWGMPIEQALTMALDTGVRMNVIHQEVLKVGLPGMPMSLKELDDMFSAKVAAMRLAEQSGMAPGPRALEVITGDPAAGGLPGVVSDGTGVPEALVTDEIRAAQRAAVVKGNGNGGSV
jgi:hypothetical protein